MNTTLVKGLQVPNDLLTKEDFMIMCSLDIDIKKIDLTTGEFEGIAVLFNKPDMQDDMFAPGAFTKTLHEFEKAGRMPGMFFNHKDFETQVGEWIQLKETKKGLFVKGLLWVEGNRLGRKSNDVAEQIRNSFLSKGPKGLSIGGMIDRSDPNAVDFVEMGKKNFKKIIRIIKTTILREISPVSFPASLDSRITLAKSEDLTIRQAEQALLDIGFSSKDCKTILSKGYSAIERDADSVTKRDASEAFETGVVIAKLKHINNMFESKE